MNKLIKAFVTIIFLLFVVVLCLFGAPTVANAANITASGTCGENLTWALDDAGTLTISGDGAMLDYGDIRAPWYRKKSSISQIVIENGVTSIGESAFFDCNNLTSITIPDSVTSIEGDAFNYCPKLAYNAYGNANYLGNAQNPYLALISATSEDITLCKIHSDTKIIYSGAFSRCTSLISIAIPDGVTDIGHHLFSGCSSLISITIPDSVTSIGDRAFYGCSSLTSITIPDSVTSIGYFAFYNCSSLTSITIPDSVTSIGMSVFEYCSSLTSITIPDSVTSIGERAFEGCSSLTNITIPDSVTIIGEYAFYNCTNLTSIAITDSVTNIGYAAFYGCTNLNVVIYCGTQAQWNALKNNFINNNNQNLNVVAKQFHNIEDGVCILCGYKQPYSIIFNDWDGSELSANVYYWGDKVTAPENPTRGADNVYTYTFAGWDRPIVACAGATTYTAAYKATYIDYTVIFKDWDGTVLSNNAYHWGDKVIAPIDPIKEKDDYYIYCFAGWDKKIMECTGDAVYQAVFTKEHYHNWEAVLTGPTCTEQGYTTHTCQCGDAYVDSYVNALGHSLENLVCTICGYKAVDLEIKTVTLRPNCAGLYYSGTFRIDEGVQVSRKGITVSLSNQNPTADNGDWTSLWAEGTTSVLISNIMKANETSNPNRATMFVYARAYVQLEDGTYIYSDVVAMNLRQVVEAADARWDTLDDGQKSAINAMYDKFETVLKAWNLTAIGAPTSNPITDVLIISDMQTVSNKTIDMDVYITSTGVATFNNVTVNGNIYCYGQLSCSSCTANNIYAYAYGSMMSCGAFDGIHGKVSGGISCNKMTILDDALDYAFNKWGKQ